ncbi:unnamed protein product [Bursaphelenchus xylophilus]|uniref:(pine wood nematode) hypothetical protein n=1 Tax=Bursaphelenchus xylophilus TaxID=6326 RepID=A0A1I7RJF5_BURXY|nr:unnamed protein product [Bursaphelenchus xylophilus]CAG9128849.1 unnamed protein product [Bursaphelenchus xylophilus]
MVEIDWAFCLSFPFGVLKTLHVIAPFAFLITVYLGPYIYSGVGFTLLVGWMSFTTNTFILIMYLLGIHRKDLETNGNSIMFFAVTIADFFANALFGALFLISTFINAIAMISGIEHRFSLFLTYLFATIFCIISTISMIYYVIRIYRACPNGNLSNLKYLVVNGKDITLREGFGYSSQSGGPRQYA